MKKIDDRTWYEKKSGKNFTKKNSPKKNQAKIPQKNQTKKTFPAKKIVQAKSQNFFAKEENYIFDISSLEQNARAVLADFSEIVSQNYPLSSKHRVLLLNEIRALSHELTDERDARHLGYMNKTSALTAYIHYFEWWNLIRLTRIFSNLPNDFFDFAEEDFCADFGSGPLTVPIALFLARPELRAKKLRWYCVDISNQALTAGENIFFSVAARLECEPWKIIRVKGELGIELKEKVAFVSAANVFNEIVQNQTMPPDFLAKKYASTLLSYAKENASIFLAEPGVPHTARFLSCLRDAFLRKNFYPLSPCPHCATCPMEGKRGGKWCNFSFLTLDSPEKLLELSKAADLPKERAVVSFLAMKNTKLPKAEESEIKARVVSDLILLPNHKEGFYACSKKGLLLLITKTPLRSGELISFPEQKGDAEFDKKSGALIVHLD